MRRTAVGNITENNADSGNGKFLFAEMIQYQNILST
jgi:hypothetical protein